ncbi:Acyltransferase family domain containing protein [Hyaloscypha variabilis]
MEAAEEEKKGLLESRRDEDGESMHSFTSSPTLIPPLSPSIDSEEEKFFHESDEHEPIFSTTAQLSPPSWRKTPLTPLGLGLLLLRVLKAILIPLLPSPLHHFLTSKPHTPRKLHATSYLDGLRGVAALIVLHSHFLTNWFYPLRSGYLATATDIYIMQLPILRLFYAGRASVAVFFVISGFALSYKPLSLLRKGSSSSGKVLEVLSSSVFRRWMRLWIPIVFGTFISALLANYALYTPVPSRGETIPPTFPTLREQLWHWWDALCVFWYPWTAVDGNAPVGMPYNGHLWTIPIEFYGSAVVFACVLGLAGVQRGRGWGKVLVGTGVVGWSLRGGRWDVSLFVGGIVCAEWSLMLAEWREGGLPIHAHPELSSQDSAFTTTHLTTALRISKKALTALHLALLPFKPLFLALSLLTSLFLLSYAGESASPGHFHAFLVPYTPLLYNTVSLGPEHFYLALGALLLLFTLSSSPTLQKPFTWRFPQYLGDISYSLYIVHGMVLFTLGTYLQQRWTGVVGEQKWVDDGMGMLVEVVVSVEPEARVWWHGFLGAAVVDWVVVFWAADVFWRGVDGRVVGWGRWVEGAVGGRR